MPVTPFDPTRAVTFDLTSGQVHLQDKQPSWVVPSAAVAELCAAAGDEATRRFGRAMGEAMGSRVASRIGKDASVESFAGQLGGEFAIAGLGSMTVERWGKALVIVVDRGAASAQLMASVMEGALQVATQREARCIRVDQQGDRSRYLVASAAAAREVEGWLAEGKPWGEALVRLHAPSQPSDERGEA